MRVSNELDGYKSIDRGIAAALFVEEGCVLSLIMVLEDGKET